MSSSPSRPPREIDLSWPEIENLYKLILVGLPGAVAVGITFHAGGGIGKHLVDANA